MIRPVAQEAKEMKRDMLKGLIMSVLVVGVMMVASVAPANAQNNSVSANVPFEFTIGGKSLPAGEYMVRAFTQNGNTLAVSNKSSSKSAIRLSIPIQAASESKNTKLVFHRYGPRYFLAEVWVAGEKTGRQLLKSKEESTIESQLAVVLPKGELLASTYEVVEIVGNLR